MILKTTRLLALFLTFSVLSISCSKDGDDGGDVDTGEQLPANKQEAEQKIKGKWNVSTSGEVRSIEFLDDKNYIMEVSATSTLKVKVASAKSKLLASTAPNNKVAENGPNLTAQIFGTFTVSNDGKTIILDDVATIKIEGISDNSFSFTITFVDEDQAQQVSSTIANAIDSSSKTNLLSRRWGYNAWIGEDGEIDEEEVAYLESKGFTPQDEGFTFTSSGTFLIHSIHMDSDTPHGPDEPTEYSAYLATTIGTWKWKDSAQTTITVTGEGDEPADMLIGGMTATSLSFVFPQNNVEWMLYAL